MSSDHFITPPKDPVLRKRLEKKLQEYQTRMTGKGKQWELWHPELAHTHPDYRDACYKADVLKAVLESELPMDTHSLCKQLHARYGEEFDVSQFVNACGTIAAYCGDSLEVPTGGPGLPEVK